MSAALQIDAKPAKHTAGTVRHALKGYFPHPEYGIVFEVAQATGFDANRRLDAMAMSLWPSRGLHVSGIEIKVARNDWRREKSNPEKAEQLARFCHYFYIASPTGVVPLSEVPANWGLLEVSDSGKIREAKAAASLKPEPVGYEFLAAVFRAASRGADPDTADATLQARREKLEAEFASRLQEELRNRRDTYKADAEAWREICVLLGAECTADRWFNRTGTVEAVRAVRRADIAGSYYGLRSLKETLATALHKVDAAISEFGIPEPVKKGLLE
jgi:hypothetical protein